MSKQLFILANDTVRQRVKMFIDQAPEYYRVEIAEPKRSLAQNAALWAVLTDIADQATHQGRKYDADTWKSIFLNALGTEMRFVPTLDGTSVFPLGMRSSKLGKQEMSDLLEFIKAWAAQNNIKINDEKEIAA